MTAKQISTPVLFPSSAAKGNSRPFHFFNTSYPMHVVAVTDLMKMTEMQPHQVLKQQGVLKTYTDDMSGKIIGVSHQWLGHSTPDPDGLHLKTLQNVLARLMSGQVKSVEWYWLQALVFMNAPPPKGSWKAALPGMYVWLDFLSMPQIGHGGEDELVGAAQAVQSIPAYMERCSLLMAIAPPAIHKDNKGVCNFATWRGRGWCRTEFMACCLAPHEIPIIACTGVNTTPFFIHPCDGPRLSVGRGRFSCCDLGHTLEGRQLECDREKVHSVLKTMIQAKVQVCRMEGELLGQSFYASLQSMLEQGLPGASGMPTQTDKKLAKVLAEQKKRDEKANADLGPVEALALRVGWDDKNEADVPHTGFTLLMCAAIAGDVAAIRELTTDRPGIKRVDPNEIKLKRNYPQYTYMIKGVGPLICAMAFSGPETVEALLDAKADPYSLDARGMDGLMYCACKGQTAVVSFWLKRFPEWPVNRLDKDVGMTAASIASITGGEKAPILRMLIEARAQLQNHDTWGREGTLLSLIATNEDSDEESLKLLLQQGCDPNVPWRSHNLQWRTMLRAARVVDRCSSSRVVKELALMDGACPLHFAAKRGDTTLVKLLTEARATPQRNLRGQTPVDAARSFFGDHASELLEAALEGKAVCLGQATHSVPAHAPAVSEQIFER